jgi:hypothetical protein
MNIFDQGTVIGRNMTFDGSTSPVWGQLRGFRTDITVMTGKYENIVKIMMYGEIK